MKDHKMPVKKRISNILEMEKENRREKVKESEKEGMISVCAAAPPCAELIHSDNRVHWGTLFIC